MSTGHKIRTACHMRMRKTYLILWIFPSPITTIPVSRGLVQLPQMVCLFVIYCPNHSHLDLDVFFVYSPSFDTFFEFVRDRFSGHMTVSILRNSSSPLSVSAQGESPAVTVPAAASRQVDRYPSLRNNRVGEVWKESTLEH